MNNSKVQSIQIPWKNSFSSGFASIDEQHKELIALINELLDRLAADCPLKSVRYYLAEIHHLIAIHFEDEEQIMQATKYRGTATHKNDHDRLLLRIRAIIDEVEQARPNLSKQQLARTLDDWFSVHFRTHDRAFHQLSEKGAKPDLKEAAVKDSSD